MVEEQNNNGKAKVCVIADADCELILDDEIVATVQADKTKQVFIERGEHLFFARSTEFPQVREEIEKIIDDLSFKYSLRIKIEDKLQPFREEKRKKEEEEQKLREEEERRRKEEAERLEREKREAEERKKEEERRRREWESMTPIEQAVKRLVQNPTSHPKTLTGHSDSVISVSWSPDGKYLACGSGYRLKDLVINCQSLSLFNYLIFPHIFPTTVYLSILETYFSVKLCTFVGK